jgi:hypothetical protein
VNTKDKKGAELSDSAIPVGLDHSSYEPFTAYYAEKSVSPEQLRHFRSVRDTILRVLDRRNGLGRSYDVVDIGCNAGGQCLIPRRPCRESLRSKQARLKTSWQFALRASRNGFP